MVRILSDNHYLYIIKRTEIEGIENQTARRITGCTQVFLFYKVCEVNKILLVEFFSYMLSPTFFYLYVHNDLS